MNGTPSNTTLFTSFGPNDSFISKNFEGLRYRHLSPSLNELFLGGSIQDIYHASLGPTPSSWILSFKDSWGKHKIAWGPSIPARLQAHLSKLSPSPLLRVFLGPSSSYIVWDADSIRWADLPISLEDSLQAWLTPAGWKSGPPRIITWGESDAFFAMSEYGDVAYRLGGDEWPTWKETVQEWKAEKEFVWSEVAYVSLDASTVDQFVAIRNDGTWAGAIDDTNVDALEAFAMNFFRLVKKKRSAFANGPHKNGSQTQTSDPATQALYASWATQTTTLFASALSALSNPTTTTTTNSPATSITSPRNRPKKLQIRTQSSPNTSVATSRPTLLTAFPHPPPPKPPCLLTPCILLKSDPASLPVCKHDVERLLRASGLYSFEWLRQERIRWHPDRFGRLCEEAWREEGRRLAGQMFVMIDILMGEVRRSE